MLLALVMGWWYFLPTPLFTVPYSTVILDKEGEIMGMTVASDGQYRVSGRGRLSMKYMAALLCFEDKRFLTHSGVDPLAIGRALWLNVRSGSVVSGGSTLTMQVIRLSRDSRITCIVNVLPPLTTEPLRTFNHNARPIANGSTPE